MSVNAIVGLCTVLGALAALVGLVLWSRRTIHAIDRIGARSAREIRRRLRQEDAR